MSNHIIVIFIYSNIRAMSKNTTILIGSIVFLFLGLIAAAVFWVYVGMQSLPNLKSANRTYIYQ